MPDDFINNLPCILRHELPDLAEVEQRLKNMVNRKEEDPQKILAGIQVYLETKRLSIGWAALDSGDDSKIAGTGKAVSQLRDAINFIKNLIPREGQENYARICRDYREYPPARQ